MLHFVDVETRAVLFSQELFKAGGTQAFVSLQFSTGATEGIHKLGVLTLTKSMFLFTNIALGALRDAIAARNMKDAQAVRAGIKMEQLSLKDHHTVKANGLSFVEIFGEERIITWGLGAFGICIWVSRREIATQPPPRPHAENRILIYSLSSPHIHSQPLTASPRWCRPPAGSSTRLRL